MKRNKNTVLFCCIVPVMRGRMLTVLGAKHMIVLLF